MWDLIGQVLASDFATVLAVCLLIVGAGFYHWRVLPQMEELERVKAQLDELRASPHVAPQSDESIAEELAAIKQIVQAFADAAPVDNLDMREGLSSVLRAIQRFERIISQQSRDHQDSSGLMREVLEGINGLHKELERIGLRLQSISSSLYTAPNTAGNSEYNDLRELR